VQMLGDELACAGAEVDAGRKGEARNIHRVFKAARRRS
jgi:hypothetical protein